MKQLKQQVNLQGNRIANPVTKSNDDKIEKQEPVEEIIISPEKLDEIIKKLRKML